VLYRSSTKTYHSPRILRHLFLTLASIGNFNDAVLAIDTYMEIILKARSRIAKGSHELDMDDYSTIIAAVSEAIKILVRYVGDGKKALELSDHIEDWLAEWRLVVQEELEDEETETVTDPELLCIAWRAVGIANACWARQTVETADRTECQEKAISAFRKGVSYDPQDVDALYDLAIVLAETRDIDSAIDTVKFALSSLEQPLTLDSDGPPAEMNEVHREYLRKSIPILHLLALLLSSSQEFDTAERMCEAAFDLFGGEMAILQTDKSAMNFDNFRDRRWNLVNGLSLGEKERLLELKMTQIALVEAQEDADAAVNMADELLSMYRSLFGNLAANEVTTQVKLEEPATAVRPSTKRSMFAGRRSKRDSVSSVAPGGSTADLSQASTLKADANSRAVSQKASREAINAPNPTIAVTDPSGTDQEDKSEATKSRRSRRVGSLTGSIRRRKSVGSVKSVKKAVGGSLSEVPSTPPPPIPRTAPPNNEKSSSDPATPTTPAHPHKQKLKDLVHHHHHKRQDSTTSNNDAKPFSSSEPGIAVTTDGETTSNLPQDEMPHPVRGLGVNHDEGKRSIKRPPTLPEPTLTEEDMKKRVSGILLRVWLLIAGLYRRAHQLEEATSAIKEAWALVGNDEKREADVWVEVSSAYPFSLE
jgi:cargo-transport protein YPP1